MVKKLITISVLACLLVGCNRSPILIGTPTIKKTDKETYLVRVPYTNRTPKKVCLFDLDSATCIIDGNYEIEHGLEIHFDTNINKPLAFGPDVEENEHMYEKTIYLEPNETYVETFTVKRHTSDPIYVLPYWSNKSRTFRGNLTKLQP